MLACRAELPLPKLSLREGSVTLTLPNTRLSRIANSLTASYTPVRMKNRSELAHPRSGSTVHVTYIHTVNEDPRGTTHEPANRH